MERKVMNKRVRVRHPVNFPRATCSGSNAASGGLCDSNNCFRNKYRRNPAGKEWNAWDLPDKGGRAGKFTFLVHFKLT